MKPRTYRWLCCLVIAFVTIFHLFISPQHSIDESVLGALYLYAVFAGVIHVLVLQMPHTTHPIDWLILRVFVSIIFIVYYWAYLTLSWRVVLIGFAVCVTVYDLYLLRKAAPKDP